MSVLFLRQLLLFLTILSSLTGFEEGIRVRFVKRFNDAIIGKEAIVQVYLTNERPESVVLVAHLDLPICWKAIPANDILIQLLPNQNTLQTFVFSVPDYTMEGEYPITVKFWGRDNPNIYDQDTSYILARDPSICYEFEREIRIYSFSDAPKEELKDKMEKDAFTLSLTSDQKVSAEPGEIVYLSCFLENKGLNPLKNRLVVNSPENWQCISSGSSEINLDPSDNLLHMFALKIPELSLAGTYKVSISLENCLESIPVMIEVASKRDVSASIVDLKKCYPINKPLELRYVCKNNGNSPINVYCEVSVEPVCEIYFKRNAIFIEPRGVYEGTLDLNPCLSVDESKQFIFFKIFDSETSELMYKNTFTLDFVDTSEENQDPYIRIPSHVTFGGVGDNNKKVFVTEWAGQGVIDPERDRFLDFLFRMPSNNRNVIYNVDQCLYLGLSEPAWDLDLGDTVYALTPLTQRYRYGRGGGFDFEDNRWSLGAHYTQNIFYNDYNPRETCVYAGYDASEELYISGNYLHRNVQVEPVSNIASLYSEYERPEAIHAELEIGNDFLRNPREKDTRAFRLETRGRLGDRTWFDFEKIYAGSAYWGYYHHMNLYSAIIDFPLSNAVNANLSMTRYKQNYQDVIDHNINLEDSWVLKPRQRQYNGNISYDFVDGSSITLNGLLFRARDVGFGSQYDFYQKWGGFTLSYKLVDWNIVNIVAYGQQHDYLTHKKVEFLQRYYGFASKQVTNKLTTTFFYEGGNTNYYDARPWRTTYGCSFGYRFFPNSFAELFLQRVNNSVDLYQLNQISLRINHTFENQHYLEILNQYFHYQSHYPNDYLFLVSYTIPFGIPVNTRKDIGHLNGYVYDARQGNPISQAMITVGGKQCITDSEGCFAMKNIRTGTHPINTEILPDQFVTQETFTPPITILGGKLNQVNIAVVPSCCIKGEISQYVFEDSIETMLESPTDNPSTIKTKILPGLRVIVSRNNGEEVYTVLTNEKGAFNFNNLRPGEWTVEVLKEGIPSLHYLNMNQVSFELNSEETKEILFKVLPQFRKMLPLE